MYSAIIISPQPGNKYRIEKDILYKDTLIPKGYITNGADIPRIFWSFLPPNRSDYMPAVIVHDYLCGIDQYKKADEYFEEIMNSIDVGKVTIFAMVSAVKLWHKIKRKY